MQRRFGQKKKSEKSEAFSPFDKLHRRLVYDKSGYETGQIERETPTEKKRRTKPWRMTTNSRKKTYLAREEGTVSTPTAVKLVGVENRSPKRRLGRTDEAAWTKEKELKDGSISCQIIIIP
ncbi:unnamed protein product [Cochlearia groenlandica]